VTVAAQLELFTETVGGGEVPAPELSRHTHPGAQRLLAALVRNGGDAAALAGLVAELEQQTTVTGGALRARPCRCDHPLEVLDEVGRQVPFVRQGASPVSPLSRETV
jgi:hypothetical protein